MSHEDDSIVILDRKKPNEVNDLWWNILAICRLCLNGQKSNLFQIILEIYEYLNWKSVIFIKNHYWQKYTVKLSSTRFQLIFFIKKQTYILNFKTSTVGTEKKYLTKICLFSLNTTSFWRRLRFEINKIYLVNTLC